LGSFVLGLLAAFFLSLGNRRKRGAGKAARASPAREQLRAPSGVDGAIAGEPLTEPSAGGKKPRARAKKAQADKRGEPGYPDGK
jgi:hypothetical protein